MARHEQHSCARRAVRGRDLRRTARTRAAAARALPNPALQIVIPDDGEVKLGDFPLNVGNTPGVFVLDLTTNASLGLNDGSAWTFANGNLTGGRADIPVQIPEPASLLLVSLGGLVAARVAGARNRRGRMD